ncbi:hypothetical protein ILYODFUR_014303 [Ilyodon furcidens]|uniref:Uncharacterized protein n=1 Tax=Ilyodon furcidens TaxID=33524 RepID=A0ABV0TUZ1_9TELE
MCEWRQTEGGGGDAYWIGTPEGYGYCSCFVLMYEALVFSVMLMLLHFFVELAGVASLPLLSSLYGLPYWSGRSESNGGKQLCCLKGLHLNNEYIVNISTH